MKKLFFAIAIALSMPLAACQNFTPNVPVTTKSTLLDEKALYAAETAYNTVAYTYIHLSENDQIDGELKATVKGKLLLAADALKALRLAYETGDSNTFASQLVKFNALVNEVKGLLS